MELPLACPLERSHEIAETPMRLKWLSDELRECLSNWGYAVCDAGFRARLEGLGRSESERRRALMESITIEFQRFGDETGVVSRSDRYIRTVGTTGPANEVCFKLDQARLVRGMRTLDYERLRGAADSTKVREVAEKFLSDIRPYLEDFLSPGPPPGHQRGWYQIDVVTRALELAQLPFEVLEESTPGAVITRRVRQPWPPPPVVRSHSPKVLFAWAEPKKHAQLQKRMQVPHERHRDLLDELLSDWGGIAGGAIVELENVTRDELKEALANEEHGFTHVHLLAHGVGPSANSQSLIAEIDLSAPPAPSSFLALENEGGTIDRCCPATLGSMLPEGAPRPASFAIATCFSGEVDSIESGGTLAHVLHAAGVPVVLASQLALTQDGSDELIKTFLAKVIDGDDPREALGACRDALRKAPDETYYDRVALVGYIHIDEDLEKRLPERKFEVALARLEAASKDADQRLKRALSHLGDAEKGLSQEQRDQAEDIARRFASVRERLDAMKPSFTKPQSPEEELYGLQASSLKREAEAAWNLSCALSGDDAKTWKERSRHALREAVSAYARAATTSRDHHWSWVQWLALDAVVHGSLEGRENDWIVSTTASEDAAKREIPSHASEEKVRDIAKQAIWAHGSLMELCLLSPLVGRGDALAQAREHLDELVKASHRLKFEFPIDSTLNQLARYEQWWGADEAWPLPAQLVDQAKALHVYLTALAANTN